jgi:transcriptional regulator with XRE-family HTH domain
LLWGGVDLNTLGKIKQLLQERKWSVYKLSKLSGVSQSTLSNMFNRNNAPSISTLEDICKAFGITLSQFFADEGELVSLNKEQTEMLGKWSTLTSDQKTALLKLL